MYVIRTNIQNIKNLNLLLIISYVSTLVSIRPILICFIVITLIADLLHSLSMILLNLIFLFIVINKLR